jgi:hypothetical protein
MPAASEGSILALAHLEQEYSWLSEKIRRDKKLIDDAEAFFDEKQYNWSRGVLNLFLCMIEKMKDQLDYEEHRHEMLAWQIVEAREGRSIEIFPTESNFARV